MPDRTPRPGGYCPQLVGHGSSTESSGIEYIFIKHLLGCTQTDVVDWEIMLGVQDMRKEQCYGK